jgi:hypothetical protein
MKKDVINFKNITKRLPKKIISYFINVERNFIFYLLFGLFFINTFEIINFTFD